MRLFLWALIQFDCCLYKKRKVGHRNRHQGGAPSLERPQEDTVSGPPCASQGERLQMNSTLQVALSQTVSLRNCEERNFCGLSHPICGTVWQPQKCNTLLKMMAQGLKSHVFSPTCCDFNYYFIQTFPEDISKIFFLGSPRRIHVLSRLFQRQVHNRQGGKHSQEIKLSWWTLRYT